MNVKTRPTKEASYNELHEILSMCNEINAVIKKYSHVSDFLPKSIKNSNEGFRKKVIRELDKEHE